MFILVTKASFLTKAKKQIKEIITYVTRHIDNDDLKNCMETGVESAEYKRMTVLLDDVKEDFNPQYLYIIKPLKENGGNHVQILVSAENYYDRYVDTEGNLYLGDITEDEYTKEEVDDYHRIMKESEIVFMESRTFWGHSYCGFYTLRDSTGAPFAILGVDLDMTQISKDILYKTINVLVAVIGICLLFFALFIS